VAVLRDRSKSQEWLGDAKRARSKCRLSTDHSIATLKNTVDQCLQDGLVAGAIAGVISAAGTGGAGIGVAEQTFQDVFTACVTANIPTDILGTSLDIRSHWSQWGACVAP
jgi:hypothetical protein